jgi:hypothetical protein
MTQLLDTPHPPTVVVRHMIWRDGRVREYQMPAGMVPVARRMIARLPFTPELDATAHVLFGAGQAEETIRDWTLRW